MTVTTRKPTETITPQPEKGAAATSEATTQPAEDKTAAATPKIDEIVAAVLVRLRDTEHAGEAVPAGLEERVRAEIARVRAAEEETAERTQLAERVKKLEEVPPVAQVRRITRLLWGDHE